MLDGNALAELVSGWMDGGSARVHGQQNTAKLQLKYSKIQQNTAKYLEVHHLYSPEDTPDLYEEQCKPDWL
jgi:hypothetical protein